MRTLITFGAMLALSGQPPRRFTIGTDNAAPYHSIGPGGVARGVVVDVLNEAARRRGIVLEWKFVHERPADALASGKVHLWPLASPIPGMEDKIAFTRPWLRNSFSVFTIEPLDIPREASVFAGAIAYIHRSATASASPVFPRARFVLVPTREEAASMVCAGKVRAALIETATLHAMAFERPPGCGGVKMLIQTLPGSSRALSLAAQRVHAAVAEELRGEVKSMIADRSLDRVLSPWNQLYRGEIHCFCADDFEGDRAWRTRLAAALVSFGALILGGIGWRLWRARAQARAALKVRTEFLNTASHELRTPLAGIIGMADIVFAESETPVQRESALRIRQAGHSLLNSVWQILDFAAFEGASRKGELSKFSIRGLVTRMCADNREAWDYKRSVVVTSVADSVPDLLEGDERLVRRILRLLLDNAVSRANARAALTIAPAASSRRDRVVLRVEVGRESDGEIPTGPDPGALALTLARNYIGSLRGKFGVSGDTVWCEFGVG